MRKSLSAVLVLALMAALPLAGAPAPDVEEVTSPHAPTAEGIRGEIARLRQLVTLDELGDDLRGNDLRDTVERRLERLLEVEAELAAARPYRALEQLETVAIFLEMVVYGESRSAFVDDAETLKKEAAEIAAVLASREEKLDATSSPSLPAALRALAEASRAKARPYQRAAVFYAESAGEKSGLYYLGAARAHLDFALFCRGLGTTERPPPTLPSLDDAIARLEVETGEAYSRPGADVEQHKQFIALNSAIKEARELTAAGRGHGALYRYLGARLRLSVILAGEGKPPVIDELRRRAAVYRERLDGAERDHSLGRLFWESAASSLAAESPDDADLRRAAAVFEHVLPEYFEQTQEPTS